MICAAPKGTGRNINGDAVKEITEFIGDMLRKQSLIYVTHPLSCIRRIWCGGSAWIWVGRLHSSVNLL